MTGSCRWHAVAPGIVFWLAALLQAVPRAGGQAVLSSIELLTSAGLEGPKWYSFSRNGGNIAGTLPEGWADNGEWDPRVRVFYARDNAVMYSGGGSIRATVTSGFLQFVQRVTLRPGAAYRLSIWLRAEPLFASMTARLVLRQMDAPYAEYGALSATIGTKWQQLVVPLAQLPGHPTGPTLDGFFMVYAPQPGTLWLDAASLAPIDSLANPTLEGPSWYSFSRNGGAIAGTLPEGWSDNGEWSPTVRVAYSRDLVAPYAGSSSVRAVVSRGFLQWGQFLWLRSGRPFRLSIWTRGEPPGKGGAALTARLVLRHTLEPYTEFGAMSATLGRTWVQLLLPAVTVPRGLGPVVSCFLTVSMAQSGTIWLDSASLAPADLQPSPLPPRRPPPSPARRLPPRSPGPAPEPPKLLTNPGMEGATWVVISRNADSSISGSLPPGWEDNSAWMQPSVRLSYARDTARPHAGASALKLVFSSGPGAEFGQVLPLAPGTAYSLSIWVRGKPPASASLRQSTFLQLSLRLAGAPYTFFGSVIAVATQQWRQVAIPLAQLPGKPSDTPLECFFNVYLPRPATLWLDSARLVVVSPGALPTVSLQPPVGLSIPRAFFGLNTNNKHEPIIGWDWPALEFGILRTWDSGIAWPTIQPNRRGEFSWGLLDKDVALAQTRGVKIIFTLGQSPPWAASRPNLPSYMGPGAGSVPKDIQDWKDFVQALAVRYRGKIHAYEVWNEPYDTSPQGFFNGEPEDLVPLGLAAAEVLSRHDPSALLLSPAIDISHQVALTWLDRYLAAGGAAGLQGVAIHYYNPSPEQNIGKVDSLRQVLATHGLQSLPLWQTEVGFDLRPAGDDFARVLELSKEAAGYLARTYLIYWALRVKTVCWYAYDTVIFEGLDLLVRFRETNPRLLGDGGKAYAQVQRWMVGASMASLASRPDGTWVAELVRRSTSGQGPAHSWVLWNTQGSTAFTPPAAWRAVYTQRLISGEIVRLRAGGAGGVQQIAVGQEPLLVAAAS